MQKLFLTIFSLFSLLLIQTSCVTLQPNRVPDFHIKKAYYQSWNISPQNKGTDVVISISKVKSGVYFKSLIFRGIEIPVEQRILRNKVVLIATLNTGMTKLKRDYKINRKANQLRYVIGNKEKSVPLNKLKRKKNKYYKTK